MSFFYNPRTKQPQIWTYPIFVILVFVVFYAIFVYGDKKSRERVHVEENTVVDRGF